MTFRRVALAVGLVLAFVSSGAHAQTDCELDLSVGQCQDGEYCQSGTPPSCVVCNCAPGEYCPPGSTDTNNCRVCPDNTFSTFSGRVSSCTACVSPRVTLGSDPSDHDEGSDCFCPQGQFGAKGNAGGAGTCTPCEAGTYKPALTPTVVNETLTACYDCPQGEIQPSTGQTQCDPCATDRTTWNNTNDKDDHSALSNCVCNVGTFEANDGTTTCQSCPAGSSKGVLDSASVGETTTCQTCGQDEYQSGTGALTCDTCPTGSSISDPGSVNDAGTRALHDARTDCVCDAGYYGTGGTANPDCTPCVEGEFQASTGQGSCDYCGPNEFSNGTASTACFACPGTQVTDDSITVPDGTTLAAFDDVTDCKCPAGTEGADGLGSCSDCADGEYSLWGASCQACPQNSFSNTAQGGYKDTSTCRPCDDEYSGQNRGTPDTTDITAHDSKLDCLCIPGYFSTAAETACETCVAGTYKTGYGDSSSLCKQCDLGHYGPNAGRTTACLQCDAGTFQSKKGQTSCEVCDDNKWQSATGQYACQLCPQGFVLLSTGTASEQISESQCDPCPAGYYADYPAAKCHTCPSGYWSAAETGSNRTTGAHWCSECPLGSYSFIGTGGSVYSEDQNPGTGRIGMTTSECQKCPVNTYRNDSSTLGDGVDKCLPCPDGEYSDEGSLTCTPCPAGTYKSTVAGEQCLPCAAGYYNGAPGLHDVCTEKCNTDNGGLPLTSRSTTTTTSGTPFNIGATSLSDCICQAGWFGGDDDSEAGTSCAICAADKYSANGATQCTTCPDGKFIADAATTASEHADSTSCDSCLEGTFKNHSSADNSIGSCSSCPLHSYQDQQGQASCIECDSLAQTNAVGSQALGDCLCRAGSASGTTGGTQADGGCIVCSNDTYTDIPQQSSCQNCATGTVTTGDDLASHNSAGACQACAAGTFREAVGDGACTICGANTFSLGTVDSCTTCPGTTIPSITDPAEPGSGDAAFHDEAADCKCPIGSAGVASNCQACGLDQYNNVTWGGTCENCPAGSIIANDGSAGDSDRAAHSSASQCSDCDPGTEQNGVGSGACVNCAAGESSSAGTSQGNCFVCGDNEYSTAGGLCQACPEGSENTGADAASHALEGSCECSIGYGGTSAPNCVVCGVDQYQDQTGQANCLDCAAGYFISTAANGNASLHDEQADCKPCPGGTYKNELIPGECQTCRNGTKSNLLEASTSNGPADDTVCVPCGIGSFGFYPPQASCSVCPQDTYADVDDTLVCTACAAGSYILDDGVNPLEHEGQGDCTQCPKGTFKVAGGCDPCPPGQWSDIGATICSNCSAGEGSPGGDDISSCFDCPIGTFSVAGTNCTACRAGTYTDTERTADDCQGCPAGTFNPDQGGDSLSFCQNCSAGEFNNLTGQSQCFVCGLDLYQNVNGSETCVPCPADTYIADNGLADDHDGIDKCRDCKAGSFWNGTSCNVCPPGSFSTQNGATSCNLCQDGQYQDESNQTECKSCPSGTYYPVGSSPGQTSDAVCLACPRGSAQNSTGQTTCDECLPGQFANETGLDTCFTCAEGSYSAGNASACTPCELGKYANESGTQNSCTACPMGTYADAEGTVECTLCSRGSANNNTGSQSVNDCVACSPGTIAEFDGDDQCDPCAAGTFANGTGNFECTDCPAGSYQVDGGQAECTKCAAGKNSTAVRATSADTCENCTAGSFSAEGSPTCELCAVGTFAPNEGMAMCYNCSAGSFANDTGLDQCLDCPAGTSSSEVGADAASTCQACSPGEFSDAGASTCDPCNPGTFSPGSGADSCQVCVAGSYSGSGWSNCTTCLAGTYSGDQAPSCLPCLAGTFSPAGSPSCTDCPAGTFQDQSSQSGCKACAAGTFNSITKRTSSFDCLSCVGGTFSVGNASICDPCAPGTISGDGANACSVCGADEYSNIDQTACDACPAGSVIPDDSIPANHASSASCSPCAGGTYAAVGQCDPCNAGQYSDDGAAVCLSCPNGTFSAQPNAATCSNCSAGEYSDEGASFCSNCTAGTFSAERSPSCTTCNLGQYSSDRASACQDCGAGEFGHTPPDATCGTCSAGTYSNASSTSCTSCSPGQYSGDAAGSCTDCPGGQYGNTTGASSCMNCTAGTYSAASSGSTTCTPCAAGTYSSAVGASSSSTCTGCPAGSYSSAQGLTAASQCQDCPAGTYSTATGRTAPGDCTTCAANTWSGATRQASSATCLNCPTGTYANGTAPADHNELSDCLNQGTGLPTPVAVSGGCGACANENVGLVEGTCSPLIDFATDCGKPVSNVFARVTVLNNGQRRVNLFSDKDCSTSTAEADFACDTCVELTFASANYGNVTFSCNNTLAGPESPGSIATRINSIPLDHWSRYGLPDVTNASTLTLAQILARFPDFAAKSQDSTFIVLVLDAVFADFTPAQENAVKDAISTATGVPLSRFSFTFRSGSVIVIGEILPVGYQESPTTPPASVPVEDTSSKGGLGTAALVGIIVGVIVFLILIVLVVIFVRKNNDDGGAGGNDRAPPADSESEGSITGSSMTGSMSGSMTGSMSASMDSYSESGSAEFSDSGSSVYSSSE